MSFPGHHKNLSASQKFGATSTWWNVDSLSDIKAMGSCLNLVITPTKVLVKSGPCESLSFNDTSLNLAAQSKTTLVLSGLSGWKMGWCGRYQTLPSERSSRLSGTFSVYPLWRWSSITREYLLNKPGSLWNVFFRSINLCKATTLSFGRRGGDDFHGNAIA